MYFDGPEDQVKNDIVQLRKLSQTLIPDTKSVKYISEYAREAERSFDNNKRFAADLIMRVGDIVRGLLLSNDMGKRQLDGNEKKKSK